jgi:hypothetical protein
MTTIFMVYSARRRPQRQSSLTVPRHSFFP